MVLKRLLAAAASVLMIGSSVKLPPAEVQAEGEDEYLCRDYHDFSGNQHYMDKYNTATSLTSRSSGAMTTRRVSSMTTS